MHVRAARSRLETLRHFAGLAELRDRLQAPLTEWRILGFEAPTKPDALWRDTAIEYDAGTYSRPRLVRKMRAFADRFPHQIWGVPNLRRKRHLQALARELGIALEVVEAPWF